MSNLLPSSPDQPAVYYQYRCKLCKLSKESPDLFKDVHSQVLEVGISLSRAVRYINDQISKLAIPVAPFNLENFQAHFNNHISLPERVNTEIIKHETGRMELLSSAAPEAASAVEDMVRRKVGNDVSDYLNLDHLRSQMTDKLNTLDQYVEKDLGDGKKVIDPEMMQLYTKLVGEIRGCITDLNKIRQSRRLINLVIKSLIEKYTFNVIRQLIREFDQIGQDMADAGLSNIEAAKINQKLRIAAAEIVATTAKNAVDDVIRSYKLS